MSKFKDNVIKAVRGIPKGKVASYGQIATLVGIPRAAIQVGWVLHVCGDDGITPWWRVINSKGYISTKCSEHTPNTQKELLKKDGVMVGKYLNVDIKKYRYLPSYRVLKKFEMNDESIYEFLEKYRI